MKRCKITYIGFCDMIGRNVANVRSHIQVFHKENFSDNALVFFIHLSDKFLCRGKHHKLKIEVQIENKSLAFWKFSHCATKLNTLRCNILIRHHFPVHMRGIHKWNVCVCPKGCTVHGLACTAQPAGIQEWGKSLHLHVWGDGISCN